MKALDKPHRHKAAAVADQDKKDPYPFSFMFLVLLAMVITHSIAKGYMNDNAAWGAGVCVLAVIAPAKLRWELRHEWWFWFALLVGALLQLPFVFFMPWAAPHLTGPGAMVFATPGFLMALGCVFLAEKIFAKESSQTGGPSVPGE
jgi:peptidoglycan/LPS O-acetylase OafA/YrhL